MSDYIPQEILLDILLKLPSKSLLQFSCVCKSWYSLISSSDFILMYTRLASTTNKNKKAQFLIRHYSRTYGKEVFTLHSDYDLSICNYQNLDCPLKSDNGYLLGFVGSCNGLVCLCDTEFGLNEELVNLGLFSSEVNNRKYIEFLESIPIVLWNPSLGRSMVLPIRKFSIQFKFVLGFGFDSKSFDYKVVRIAFDYGAFQIQNVEIFTLGENSWRSIGVSITFPSYTIIRKLPQTFFNGNIHWIGYYHVLKRGRIRQRLTVATFDVSDEMFGEIAMPKQIARKGLPDENCRVSIVVLGNSLSLILYDQGCYPSFNRCCIWVMNQYGVSESWTKLHTISPYYGFGKTLQLRMNGNILLVTSDGELVSFDPESRTVDRLNIYGETCSFFYVDAYVESLVLSNGFNRLLGQASSSNACNLA